MTGVLIRLQSQSLCCNEATSYTQNFYSNYLFSVGCHKVSDCCTIKCNQIEGKNTPFSFAHTQQTQANKLHQKHDEQSQK